jgi:hypothetical protein
MNPTPGSTRYSPSAREPNPGATYRDRWNPFGYASIEPASDVRCGPFVLVDRPSDAIGGGHSRRVLL